MQARLEAPPGGAVLHQNILVCHTPSRHFHYSYLPILKTNRIFIYQRIVVTFHYLSVNRSIILIDKSSFFGLPSQALHIGSTAIT